MNEAPFEEWTDRAKAETTEKAEAGEQSGALWSQGQNVSGEKEIWGTGGQEMQLQLKLHTTAKNIRAFKAGELQTTSGNS